VVVIRESSWQSVVRIAVAALGVALALPATAAGQTPQLIRFDGGAHDRAGAMTTDAGRNQTAKDDGHGADANVFGVINAGYTDSGGSGVPSLSGTDEAILQPKRKQAEHYTSHQGIQTENTSDPMGGRSNIGWIDHGDWVAVKPMNLLNVNRLDFRVASAGTGGRIELHAGSPTGPLAGTVPVAP
jgi:cytochrome c